MCTRITASSETLMRQASITARDYLDAAIESINDAFGEGYASRAPELVATFMQIAARDFHSCIATQAIQEGVERIADALRSVNNAD